MHSRLAHVRDLRQRGRKQDIRSAVPQPRSQKSHAGWEYTIHLTDCLQQTLSWRQCYLLQCIRASTCMHLSLERLGSGYKLTANAHKTQVSTATK